MDGWGGGRRGAGMVEGPAANPPNLGSNAGPPPNPPKLGAPNEGETNPPPNACWLTGNDGGRPGTYDEAEGVGRAAARGPAVAGVGRLTSPWTTTSSSSSSSSELVRSISGAMCRSGLGWVAAERGWAVARKAGGRWGSLRASLADKAALGGACASALTVLQKRLNGIDVYEKS